MKNRMLLIAAVAILVAAPAMAFHDGGVAYCQGCHTMHNSQANAPMNFSVSPGVNPGDAPVVGTGIAVGTGYDDLLLFPNATDTCLRCHGNNTSSYNVFESNPIFNPADTTSMREYYSAGNFAFLLEDNINDGRGGATSPISGMRAGHNIRSGIKGSTWDTVNLYPPGGQAELANNMIECTSCHDPHGQDSFRILYQQGQIVDVAGDDVTFAGTMVADEISYGAVETLTTHNAYHSGYSEWCGSCHGDFHNSSGNLIHPSGEQMTAEIVDKYNAYRGTADCVTVPPSGGAPCGSGDASDAYLPDVPFEDVNVTTSSTTGPTVGSSYVACVSCHRAHATSAADAGRWDFTILFLSTDGVTSGSFGIPYAQTTLPADDDQRSLCNKCHSQDEYDHLVTP
ncbi:MAG: hypothetical protein NDJ75_00115 [Thermoanaerobaculia bacterium]|nr:hypothetical protein [Thermoanaerobaculia bacterium]